MKWLADLLDRFLDWIAPIIPDFSGGPDWLSDELLHLSADAPTHSESDTPARVSGVPTGSPDLPLGTPLL